MATLLSCLFDTSHATEATQTPAAKTQPSIADFVKQRDFSDIKLSPSGKYIAAVISLPDEPHENAFAILDGRTGSVVRFIHSGERALINSYFWANDERLVASLSYQFDKLDTPYATGEIFSIDADGTKQVDLFGIRKRRLVTNHRDNGIGSVIYSKPTGSDEILVESNDPTNYNRDSPTLVQLVNVNTGEAKLVGKGPTHDAELVADHSGQVRAATRGFSGYSSSLWIRKDNDSDWILINNPAKSRVNIDPIGFNRDNSKLYVLVSSGTGPDSIQLMDMSSLKRSMVYQGQFADPGEMLRTADGQDYYAIVTMDGKEELHFLDDNALETRLTKALQASFPGQLVLLRSFTANGKRAMVEVSSDRNPGDYYVLDTDTMQAGHLVKAMPQIDPQQQHAMEPIAFGARDGLTIHGFLTLPDGPKPYPLIVLPHGGPQLLHDVWEFNREAQLFASRGYAVLQVNYRGSGGYGSWFQTLGYRKWGLTMQDDLTDATHWAIDKGYATQQRVCIYGASYGGYAALEGVVREPELYKCAIGYAGVYDLRVQLDDSDTVETRLGRNILSMILGDDRDELLARSPLSGVPKIKADLLLLHGGKDPRVPIKNFYELTHALDKNHKHYEQLVMPQEGHGFFVPEHNEQAYETMLQFLDRNIGHSQSAAVANATP